MITKLKYFLVIALLIAFAPLTLNAKEPKPTDKDDKKPAKLQPVKTIQLSTVHHHYMEPDQFGIKMNIPDAISGCYDVSNLVYETKYVGGYFMDIKVKGYKKEIVTSKDPNFVCDMTNKRPSAMVIVSANDLKQRGVQQIRFMSERGEDPYQIEYSDQNITIVPISSGTFIAANGMLTHNFGTKGRIALHVPMATKDDDIAQAIRTFAARKGLTAVDQAANDNDSYYKFYFDDTNGAVISQIGDAPYADVGSIKVPRPYNDGSGPQGIAVPLKVFATYPETSL